MNKTELVNDAKRSVKNYIERGIEANGEKMIYPVLSIKLDHDPEGEWDGIGNAVLVSRDVETGEIHLYVMTCIMHKEIVEQMFDTKIQDYIGHIVVDNEEESKKYLKLVKNFSLDTIRDLKTARQKRFPEWDNL